MPIRNQESQEVDTLIRVVKQTLDITDPESAAPLSLFSRATKTTFPMLQVLEDLLQAA